jgi:hypothetical protein
VNWSPPKSKKVSQTFPGTRVTSAVDPVGDYVDFLMFLAITIASGGQTSGATHADSTRSFQLRAA